MLTRAAHLAAIQGGGERISFGHPGQYRRKARSRGCKLQDASGNSRADARGTRGTCPFPEVCLALNRLYSRRKENIPPRN